MKATTRPAQDRPSPEDAPIPPGPRRLILGVPTSGRREILTETVRHITEQERLPDLVVLAVAQERDIDRAALTGLPFPIKVVVGARSLSARRNRILEQIELADILMFLDDDFLMAPNYFAEVMAVFERHPYIVLATGAVIADGVVGRGYDHETGQQILDREAVLTAPEQLKDVYNGYGCNMAVRARPILTFGLRFDEALPLYSWLEDIDFSRQLADYGRLVRSNLLRGVHLGTRTGRTPGRRLGYSQIVNPVYMLRKGTVSTRKMLLLTGQVFASNLVHSIRPRQWIDSRGRLRGNLRAFWDILRGKIDPRRASEI
ncbi:glycosyltransferase [Tropicimonas sp. TH_r6]|uniref:glycosyltransferase family 2 protein n=1 Tax=Tropicimonas sp. TH_r6 TaxID=3082085 RepID=UPI0029558C1F|nr:glycosyltransferase [Tropicimonas sp. TH_r6]MDV7143121.1 glycosyltransferase [Tropicimonas sp. TH_r6]